MSSTFQLVHYVPNLFLGGRLPVAAMLLSADAKLRLVRAAHLPDEHCLGGRDQVVALNFALARLERDPSAASTAALGAHVQFDPPRQVPHGVEADKWLREAVLPQPPAARDKRSSNRATRGYAWLQDIGLGFYVNKQFRPEKFEITNVSKLQNKGLKPISHWVSDGEQLLLLEPLIPRGDRLPFEDVATNLGAYRFHLGDSANITLGVYLLRGGSPEARDYAQRSLQSSAHRVFDTTNAEDRNILIATVSALGRNGDPRRPFH